MIININDYPDIILKVNNFYTDLYPKLTIIDAKYYNDELWGNDDKKTQRQMNYIILLLPILIRALSEKQQDSTVQADSVYVPDCYRKFYKCLGINIEQVITNFLE